MKTHRKASFQKENSKQQNKYNERRLGIAPPEAQHCSCRAALLRIFCCNWPRRDGAGGLAR
jgi:hypothetical protein